MRTTIDLPEELHGQARALARDRAWTLSKTVAWLMRRGLSEGHPSLEIGHDDVTGFPAVRIGRIITSAEVNQFLEDEE